MALERVRSAGIMLMFVYRCRVVVKLSGVTSDASLL